MRQTLILHPACVCPPIRAIEAEVTRSLDLLTLRYVVTGTIEELSLPAPVEPVRAEGLWEHTCFEAFIGTLPAYLELNLAPSRAWAAYRFDGYRSGRRDAGIRPLWIVTGTLADRFELRAEVQINRWEGRLGLSAVIEEKNGNKSYWALVHPPGDPDFHHETCFALQLPAATAP